MQKKLYVDDIREAPDSSWTVVRTVDAALIAIDSGEYDIVSLDHDLADHYENERTGYTILMHIVERKMEGLSYPKEVLVHSANPVGVERMLGVIERYLK